MTRAALGHEAATRLKASTRPIGFFSGASLPTERTTRSDSCQPIALLRVRRSRERAKECHSARLFKVRPVFGQPPARETARNQDSVTCTKGALNELGSHGSPPPKRPSAVFQAAPIVSVKAAQLRAVHSLSPKICQDSRHERGVKVDQIVPGCHKLPSALSPGCEGKGVSRGEGGNQAGDSNDAWFRSNGVRVARRNQGSLGGQAVPGPSSSVRTLSAQPH